MMVEETAGGAEIVAMEMAALERWCKGDPNGFLEISGDEVRYFDPFLDKRLDGKAALSDYYRALAGKIFADSFEMIDPVVQLVGDAAVLTFNFISRSGDGSVARWNCTEVYALQVEGWRIVQTHWSFTAAGRK